MLNIYNLIYQNIYKNANLAVLLELCDISIDCFIREQYSLLIKFDYNRSNDDRTTVSCSLDMHTIATRLHVPLFDPGIMLLLNNTCTCHMYNDVVEVKN